MVEIMKLSDYIRVFDNVITELTCERIIQEYHNNESRVKRYNSGYKFNQLNLTDSTIPQLSNVVANQLIPYYTEYFTDLNAIEYVNIDNFEEVRIKHYKKNQDEFPLHVDIADKISCSRFAIAIMYLNVNNGYTEFPTLQKKIYPAPGRLVIFPPNWMFPHRGIMPTDEDKYILMSCLMYN